MKVSANATGNLVSISFESNDDSSHIGSAFWKLPAEIDPRGARLGNASAITALIPSMARNTAIEVVDHPVDARLLDNLYTAQEVWSTWARAKQRRTGIRSTYHQVPIIAESRSVEIDTTERRGTALMFSAGVDSFYTALTYGKPIDAFIFVHGLDVKLDDPLRDEVAIQVRRAAAELGTRLIELETNARSLTDPIVPWEDTHGAVLAAAAHLLGDEFARFVIPATHTYDNLYPLGSHPVLDPLWGSSDVEFIHHGCGADRVAKLASISESPVACRWLRVCPRYDGGSENCGRCEKCLRTMVGIRLAGVSDAVSSLPELTGILPLWRVATVRAKGRASTWYEYLAITRSEVPDRALRLAIQAALARHYIRTTRTRFSQRRNR